MKFLIAGFGSIGRRHFRNLLAMGEKDILLYRSNQSTLPDDEISGFPVETNLQAALDHHPDAVIVSNPTALHLDVAIPAAQAGCAILLEKPISHSLDHAREFHSIVKDNGAQVLVGFQFRYHPTLRRAAQLIASGAIGAPATARAHWGEYLPDWHPWEDYRKGYAARPDLGGGVILTLCHPFDYLRMLLGDVSRVWALTPPPSLELPVEDAAEIGLQFASGSVGSIHLDYVQQPPSHTLEVIGSAGLLRWNNADGGLAVYDPLKKAWEVEFPPEGFERNSMFIDEIRNLLGMLRGEAAPECTLEDGIRALEVALLALQSAGDGLQKHIA